MKKSRIACALTAAAVAASLTAFSGISASAEESYNAYIGVQSASFTFRNAWNEDTYGKDIVADDGTVWFDQLTGWDGPTALNKGGNFTDAVITGDGTYSVSVTDFDFGDDETFNLLFISTDIPLDKEVSFTDVKVILDGQTKYTFDDAYLSPDEATYYSPMMINIWNDDLGKQDGLFGYVMPEDSIEIQFTVSGLGAASSAEAETEAETEAATEAAPEATEAPKSDSTTTSSKTGNVGAAAVAAVMVAAGAAALVSKKK
ncbi:MAG: hypothetical protein K2K57_03580 [Oscillospiraceae bacterium]|nr:hypothetical protein [Oscillospiraceae bacterium]